MTRILILAALLASASAEAREARCWRAAGGETRCEDGSRAWRSNTGETVIQRPGERPTRCHRFAGSISCNDR